MDKVKIKAKHAIISPVCRSNRGDMGAFEEAIERIRQEYLLLKNLAINIDANFHIILEVERPLNAPEKDGG